VTTTALVTAAAPQVPLALLEARVLGVVWPPLRIGPLGAAPAPAPPSGGAARR
jgi:hypothetical protein